MVRFQLEIAGFHLQAWKIDSFFGHIHLKLTCSSSNISSKPQLLIIRDNLASSLVARWLLVIVHYRWHLRMLFRFLSTIVQLVNIMSPLLGTSFHHGIITSSHFLQQGIVASSCFLQQGIINMHTAHYKHWAGYSRRWVVVKVLW
jgi:hypothetical protein